MVVDECGQKIRYTLSTVKTLQRLEDNNIALVENAVKAMRHEPVNRESKLYWTFLVHILRLGRRELVVLYASSLGKQRIVSLNKQERLQIIQCLKANKTLFDCPILEDLAVLYQVPRNGGMSLLPTSPMSCPPGDKALSEIFPSTNGDGLGATKKRSWDQGTFFKLHRKAKSIKYNIL